MKLQKMFRLGCIVLPFVAAIIVVLIVLTKEVLGGSLSNQWDFVDVNGGYSTTTYNDYSGRGIWTQMYTDIGGQHKIDNASVSISPNSWYWDGKLVQNGYVISEWISGEITTPLTPSDVGNTSQYNSFNARGLVMNEDSYVDIYQNNGSLFCQAGAYIQILNFKVWNANGNYSEYTPNNGGLGCVTENAAGGGIGTSTTTYFNYSVVWYGDFLPGTLSNGFVAPNMSTEVAAVPEPSAIIMLSMVSMGIPMILLMRKR